jgi:hypothetical protein
VLKYMYHNSCECARADGGGHSMTDSPMATVRRPALPAAAAGGPEVDGAGCDGRAVADGGRRRGDGNGRCRHQSDCHFRNTAREYDRKPGMKWVSCTAK